MKKKKKKYLWAIFPFLLLCSVLLYTVLSGRMDTVRLNKLETALLQDSYENDTLSLHFALTEPEKWNLSEEKASLPVYSKEDYEQAVELLKQQVNACSDIHKSLLPEAESLRFRLLEEHLSQAQDALAFPYYEEPLSPSSGAQSQLPVLFAEYAFRDREDVEHYLALLEQTEVYFDGLIQYEQEKAAAGLFMSDESAQAVMAQCSSIPDAARLQDGSHFLCQTFEERLEPLLKQGRITKTEQEHYIAENSRILTTIVAPAYEKLADALFVLSGSKPETKGLASLPKGREYYQHLVSRSTGSSKSIPELKKMLTNRLQEDFHALAALSASHNELLSDPAAIAAISSQTDALLPSTPEKMLQDLKQQMKTDFPLLALDGSPLPDTYIRCRIKSVSESLEDYVSPAYYFTPPCDNIQDNTIYINQSQTPHGLPLYTTLAHEGYPGHLYQSVFFQLYEEPDLPPVRSLYYYGGYIEGWALYVEMLSYDFAKTTLLSAGSDASATSLTCTLERLNRDMQLCLYSLLDIAIHYDGASQQEVQEVLAQFGLSSQTGAAVYRYIAEEPSNYLKYFVGYLEILECREYAKEIWGEQYSDKRFHTFFLESGPCSFALLRERIPEYTD